MLALGARLAEALMSAEDLATLPIAPQDHDKPERMCVATGTDAKGGVAKTLAALREVAAAQSSLIA
jgi:hypothetical protein